MITGEASTLDTCVDEQYPNSNYHLRENLWTGGKTGTNTMRTYIKFNLPTDISAQQVTKAYLNVKKWEYAAPTIKAYRVASNWTPSEVTWNNKPGYTPSSVSSAAENYTGAWYRMDVTAMVKQWLDGTFVNHGFLLKEPNETNADQKTKFYSSDAPSPNKPELVIEYTDPTYYTITYSAYTITYSANGSTSGTAPIKQTVQAGRSVVLDANTGNLGREGRTLLGWNTQGTGSGKRYALGQTIVPVSDLTLYAEWSEHMYPAREVSMKVWVDKTYTQHILIGLSKQCFLV